ncbi:MAG: carbohydrate ABC transporter permease [Defluviitaleaceae bacterium]|nr:carbohydrate ABC transporter permease [Defluviitaleaceae bacterium]MCL2835805.1 carbohydrate ABC transporter permease [Defluviitaleaceae bacterium]
MISKNNSKIGDTIIILVFIILIMLCIIPMMNVFSRSLSSSSALVRNEVGIWPRGLNFDAFRAVSNDPKYFRSLIWTVILTLICTLFSLFLTVCCAYPFVYKQLKGRRIINTMLIFTMYFSAGTIPNFLLMKSLGLLDHPLVLIIPSALSVYNMILMRSFFYGLSDSLRESAEMDGAGPLRVLTSIYLPLSKPALATIALFYAVSRWNGYGDALVFMNNAREWYPIQLLLYNIQQDTQSIEITLQEGFAPPGLPQAVRAATVVIATIPILCVYPFLQKYFVQGVTLGAVKE